MNTKIRKHNHKKFAKSIMITKVIKITKLNQFRILFQPKLLQRYNRVICFLDKNVYKESLFFPFLILSIKETFINLQKLRISLTNNRIKNNTYQHPGFKTYIFKQWLGLRGEFGKQLQTYLFYSSKCKNINISLNKLLT